MKKIYIQPSMEVHKIETANMIATSPNDVTISRNAAAGINANQVGSRGSSGWDDED